jgi:hypothetical protein
MIATDGAGGAIIAWSDSRNFSDVYAQRIDASGAIQWATNGIVVCDAYNAQAGCRIVSDGQGGAICAWGDTRAASGTADMYAQRINALGASMWTPNGNIVSNAPQQQAFPIIAPDGAAGAIVAWADWRVPASDVYSQRMTADGSAHWTSNGAVESAAQGDQFPRDVASDGAGGSVCVWEDQRTLTSKYDIYAQRVDGAGSTLWAADGLAICTEPGHDKEPALVSDGNNGFLIVWTDGRGSYYNIFAQHVDANGSMLWANNGIAVAPALKTQTESQVVSDGAGGVLVIWKQGNGNDIYAQRLSGSGQVPSAVGPDAAPHPVALGANVPNPFSSNTRLDVYVPTATSGTLDVYDVLGRKVVSRSLPSLSKGWQQLDVDGRSDRGQLLPSGVYFVRLNAAGQVSTRKVVIQR